MEGDEERIALIQEWFGYCCTPNTKLEKAMLFEGLGRNGKSQAIEVLRQLVGSENCSMVPLEKMHHRFQLTSTVGKLVNFATETAPNRMIDDALLKRFISGEPVETEFKGKDGFQFEPTARVLVAMNEKASIRDYSNGIWRRLLVVPFNYEVPEDKIVLGLGDKIARAELPGILNWAIQGLIRLEKNGCFTKAAATEAALAEYRNEKDPVRHVLLELFEVDESGEHFLCSTTIWNLYAEYSRDHDLTKPVEDTALLCRILKKHFPNVKSTRVRDGKNRLRGWTGVKLKECHREDYGRLLNEAGLVEAVPSFD